MKLVDEHGRKFRAFLIGILFFAAADLGAVAKVWIGEKLEADLLLQVAGGVALLVGTYIGGNAWSKHAEAKIEEAKATAAVAQAGGDMGDL